jgi:hypothetical protein
VDGGYVVHRQPQERHQLLRNRRALDITQKSAWFMMRRIRLAMEDGSVERLRGRVEADETFIGGKVPDEGQPEPVRDPTPWERFVALARRVAQTPKTETEKREQTWREERKRKRRG